MPREYHSHGSLNKPPLHLCYFHICTKQTLCCVGHQETPTALVLLSHLHETDSVWCRTPGTRLGGLVPGVRTSQVLQHLSIDDSQYDCYLHCHLASTHVLFMTYSRQPCVPTPVLDAASRAAEET